jgi:hypothetical protein
VLTGRSKQGRRNLKHVERSIRDQSEIRREHEGSYACAMSICIVVDFVGARGYQIAKQCSLNLIASLARKETYLVAWYDVDLLRLRLRC